MALTSQRSPFLDWDWPAEQCCARLYWRLEEWLVVVKGQTLIICQEACGTDQVNRTSGSGMQDGTFLVNILTFTRHGLQLHKASYFLGFFLQGDEVLVEEMRQPRASFMSRFLSLMYFFPQCHHDLIRPFHETYNKLKVPLTMWLNGSEGLSWSKLE